MFWDINKKPVLGRDFKNSLGYLLCSCYEWKDYF
jgi:hypothetical protein